MALLKPWRRVSVGGLGIAMLGLNFATTCFQTIVGAAEKSAATGDLRLGRELFEREWLPNDSRSRGGDGLGPVFNDSSCVACHNQGGTGGGGPASKNVDLVSIFSADETRSDFDFSLALKVAFGGRLQPRAEPEPKPRSNKDVAAMARIHPGFRTARSVVLHRSSTRPGYESLRDKLGNSISMKASSRGHGTQMRDGPFTLVTSQRNTTALFGAGLIDSIPDAIIEAGLKPKETGLTSVKGRVSRLRDGKIGRFGWKAQKATLREFGMTACAVELGLNVPEHEQAGVPQEPEYASPGLDMNEDDCNALVAYLAALPAPVERHPGTDRETKFIEAGRKLFTQLRCSACHTPKLGDVDGLYSDLLLHDMGPELGDTGSYGVFLPNSAEEELRGPAPQLTGRDFDLDPPPTKDEKAVAAKKIIGARRLEWRTPPLWGVRDSAPYLHDGRADTLEQAIEAHGGEGRSAAKRFLELTPEKRLQLISFLKTLAAPDQLAAARP